MFQKVKIGQCDMMHFLCISYCIRLPCPH